MEVTRKRILQNGTSYNSYFPAATGIIKTIKQDASVDDSVAFIQQIVPRTLHQTKAIATRLKGKTVHETCSNIWHFVYRHIAYCKDKQGYEQIRSPRRSWRDRRSGVDCDCYSTFISSMLCNLGIPHYLRITKYAKNHFQHIYPVVPDDNKYITIDCVTDRFNHEVPYSEKKDFTMDLQYLDGLDSPKPYSSDTDLIFSGYDGLGLFGKKKKRKAAEAAAIANPSTAGDTVPGSGVKKKKGLKKLLNVANKLNPATLLLRNGVLASMKLNIGKVGSRLRWSYVSPNKAKTKGIDMNKYNQLVKVRQKLENIFYGAGGNPLNLKNAILKGKGNKDKAVNGFLGLGNIPLDEGVLYMNTNTPLAQLLGPDIYYSENVYGMEGFEGTLGEPITLATIAAASGVIAGIVGMLKKVGDLFGGKKTQGSEDFNEETTAVAEKEIAQVTQEAAATPGAAVTSSFSADNSGSSSSAGSNNNSAIMTIPQTNPPMADSHQTADTPLPTSSVYIAKTAAPSNDTFWTKNKNWLLPVGIGVAGIAVFAIVKSSSKHPVESTAQPMHGSPPHKNYRRKTGRRRSKMTAVALI